MVRHQLFIFQGMRSTNGNNRLVSVQGTKGRFAVGLAPFHFLLQHVKHGHDIAEASAAASDISSRHVPGTFHKRDPGVVPLQRDIAVCDRNHGHLELLGRGAEGQQQCQDIIDTWVGCVSTYADIVILGFDSTNLDRYQ